MTPLACPHCRGQTFYMPEYAGQIVACPHCGGHILMTLPEGPAEVKPAARHVPAAKVSAAHSPPKQGAAALNSGGKATRSSNGAAIAVLAVLGIVGFGLCLLVALVGGYLLLAREPKVPVAENVQPVGEHAPSAMEILAEFPAAPSPGTPVVTAQAQELANPPVSSNSASPGPRPVSSDQIPRSSVGEPNSLATQGFNEPSAPPPVNPVVVAPGLQPVASSPPASLSQVVRHAELPTLASTAVEPLTPLGVAQPKDVRLRLISTAADIPDRASFVALRSKDEPLAWEVAYTPDLQAEVPQTVAVGSFILSLASVSFRWHQPFSEPELRRQLKNCVLVIEADNQFAHVALRPPISSEFIRLDLSRDKQLEEFLLPDLPKKSQVFAEIKGDGFPVEPTGGVFSLTLPVGPDEEKKFDQLPGAELGLKLTADGSGLNLTVAPRFREKGSLIPLSRPKLESTKKATEQAIVRANAEIDEESQKISSYRSQIRKLPGAPAGSPAAVARGITLSKLEQNIKRSSNRMSSLQRQIPALEARLKAVPAVEAFMDRLDGRQLSVQIYADCGDYRLSLVVAGSAEANGANGQSLRNSARPNDRQMTMTVNP